MLKLYLVKHRVEGSTYPTLAATLVVETLFDAVVGIALLLWAVYLGVLPNIHSLPNLPNIDLRWAFKHPLALEIGALVLGIAIGVLLVWATARVQALLGARPAGLRDPPRRRGVLARRRVVAGAQLGLSHRRRSTSCCARSICRRRSTTRCSSRSRRASRLCCRSRPAAPGPSRGFSFICSGARPPRSALLSFSVGTHIAIVVVNVVLGLLAIVLMTRTLRLRRLRASAKADSAEAAADKPSS